MYVKLLFPRHENERITANQQRIVSMSMERIQAWFRERGITEVECLVPDITGNARGKIIPSSRFFREEGMRLPESIFVQTVNGDWPDEFDEIIDPREYDLILKPDPDSVRVVPWVKDPTAQVICGLDEFYEDPLLPRSILQRILRLYRDKGWEPVMAPELEFYLVQRNTDPDNPLLPPVGRSGRPETARQSYSIDAVNEFDPLFEDMYDFCEAMELNLDSLIHEGGAAQLEVNFIHGDALELADHVFFYKRTMREAAMRHDVYATFMAKPMESEPGSSMHIHQSMVDKETGKNIFVGADDKPNALFLSYIAGLQKYAPYATALFAPNVNSYRRFARGDSAPINVHWGYDNRSCGLRVPIDKPQATRVENRFAGADANPYLAFAISLACGYLGIMEGLKPSEPLITSAYDSPFALPRSLGEALDRMDQCDPLKTMLGERFIGAYGAIKRKEYETFFQVISSWEREFLLLNV
jgi:glutamine synthetase